MLTGRRDQSVASRCTIQSWSDQVKFGSCTTEAVAGGISVAKAIGSAFSCQLLSAPRIRNLYRDPAGRSGTNSSHTPEEPIDRIGLARGRPTRRSRRQTRTPRAEGAHTANDVPCTGPFGVS